MNNVLNEFEHHFYLFEVLFHPLFQFFFQTTFVFLTFKNINNDKGNSFVKLLTMNAPSLFYYSMC